MKCPKCRGQFRAVTDPNGRFIGYECADCGWMDPLALPLAVVANPLETPNPDAAPAPRQETWRDRPPLL
jgi:hypothetical protein